MKVFIGSDHRGYNLKEFLNEWLIKNNYVPTDLGDHKYDSDDDYTDYAIKVAEKAVAENVLGIVICGSGVGVCIAANKVVGARAALCVNEKQARLAREDDNANILCLGANVTKNEDASKIVKIFLETIFSSEERHIRRLNKIKEYETKNN